MIFIYLLIAIGGSSTLHIYTKTIQRITQYPQNLTKNGNLPSLSHFLVSCLPSQGWYREVFHDKAFHCARKLYTACQDTSAQLW
jgi:hypothetical protein